MRSQSFMPWLAPVWVPTGKLLKKRKSFVNGLES